MFGLGVFMPIPEEGGYDLPSNDGLFDDGFGSVLSSARLTNI